MRYILSFGISIISLIIEIIIIMKYYFAGGKQGLEGAGWILATIGSPLTFLDWILYRIGLTIGFMPSFISLAFLYLLQYQLIAFFIYKGIIDITTKRGIIYLVMILVAILISARIMWNMLGLSGPPIIR